jgi:hypothetical protein
MVPGDSATPPGLSERRLRRWWYESRFLDVLFYLSRDGRTRTPSTEQQRREAMLEDRCFPALLLIGKSERAITIEGSLAALLPKPKRNWLFVTCSVVTGGLRVSSDEADVALDQTIVITSAKLWGETARLNGPTQRLIVTRPDGSDMTLAVGDRQATRILALLNPKG